MQILAKLAPKTVLEIGTGRGGTLYLWSKVAAADGVLISIDLPKGCPEWKIPFYKSFGSANQEIHLLPTNSHDKTTLREVKRIPGGRKVDFLFIDGDHSYEEVKSDFEMYSELMEGERMIALHDIVHPEYPEVEKFWKEIKKTRKFKTKEIISASGIGLIYT